MNNFARNLVKQLADEGTSVLEDGLNISESSGTIDTGSLLLNAALSTSLFGGVQDNKIAAFAGEEATGKTFFALAIAYAFQQNNPDGILMYYDTEAAVTKKMMQDRGLDIKRVIIVEKSTVQEFKTHLLQALAYYQEQKDAPKLMVVLDSLGQLASLKEMDDARTGKEVVDMTKAKVIRSTFRVLQLELAKCGVPLIVTNHTYAMIGSFIPQDEMQGGGGLKYAASTICFLTKKKDRDGTDVVGNIITVTVKKSRFTKENKKVPVRISYDRGLDRYYGLEGLAEKYGLIKKVSAKPIKYEFPAGVATMKDLTTTPEKFYTTEFLAELDKCAQREFSYGTEDIDTSETTDE